ncbi:hypothetical protein ACNKHU_18335 [Shigella flexneri]
MDAAAFWHNVDRNHHDLAPSRQLLAERDRIQAVLNGDIAAIRGR